MSEELTRESRLRKSRDFRRCYKKGRRIRGPNLMLCVASNSEGTPRVGFTLSRKVGNSVARNLLKRRLKENFRQWEDRVHLPNIDIVFHVHPSWAQQSHSACEREATKLLEKDNSAKHRDNRWLRIVSSGPWRFIKGASHRCYRELVDFLQPVQNTPQCLSKSTALSKVSRKGSGELLVVSPSPWAELTYPNPIQDRSFSP